MDDSNLRNSSYVSYGLEKIYLSVQSNSGLSNFIHPADYSKFESYMEKIKIY